MALDATNLGIGGDSRLRLIYFTCAHQADYVHKDEKPDERVDGRHALNHLWQLQLLGKELEDVDGIPTRLLCLGDMTTKDSLEDGWEALQAVKERGIISIIGNHDAYNFSREQIEEATGAPSVSYVQKMGRVAAVNLNPMFNREVELVPGANLLPDGRDWADTYRDTTKIIRNYIPVAHAEALYSWFKEKVPTGEVTKKKKKPILKARKSMIDAWAVAAHNKPESKPKFETGNEAGDKILRTERIKGPEKLLCRLPEGSPLTDALETDEDGHFEMIHMDKVVSEISKIMGKKKPCIGEFYGDQHPTSFKVKDNHVILPAFSSAKPDEVPQGFCLEVLYDEGVVTRIEHVIPYDEQKAEKAKEVLTQEASEEQEHTTPEEVSEDELVLA